MFQVVVVWFSSAPLTDRVVVFRSMAPLSQFVEVVRWETTGAGAMTTGAGSTTDAAGTSTAGGNAATESTSFVLVKQPETIPLTAMNIASEDSFK